MVREREDAAAIDGRGACACSLSARVRAARLAPHDSLAQEVQLSDKSHLVRVLSPDWFWITR